MLEQMSGRVSVPLEEIEHQRPVEDRSAASPRIFRPAVERPAGVEQIALELDQTLHLALEIGRQLLEMGVRVPPISEPRLEGAGELLEGGIGTDHLGLVFDVGARRGPQTNRAARSSRARNPLRNA